MPLEHLSEDELASEWPYLTRTQVREYRDAFKIFDRDKRGTFTAADLAHVMQTLGQKPQQAELDAIIRDMDADGDGVIDFAEFIVMMLSLNNTTSPERELKDVFAVFDRSGSGNITADELRSAIKNIGENLSDADVETVLRLADKTQSGSINYDEFVQFVLSGKDVPSNAFQASDIEAEEPERPAPAPPSGMRFFGALQKLRKPGSVVVPPPASEPAQASGADPGGLAHAFRRPLSLKARSGVLGMGHKHALPDEESQAGTSGEAPADVSHGWKPFNWLRLGDRLGDRNQSSSSDLLAAVQLSEADTPGYQAADVESGIGTDVRHSGNEISEAAD